MTGIDSIIALAMGAVGYVIGFGITIPFSLEWLQVVGGVAIMAGYAITKSLAIPRSKTKTLNRFFIWILVCAVIAIVSMLVYQWLIQESVTGPIAVIAFAVTFSVFFFCLGFIAACAQVSLVGT